MTISVSSETTKKYQENNKVMYRVDDDTLEESFKFIIKVNFLQH